MPYLVGARRVILSGGIAEINVTCPTITPTLGSELLTNGNMESGDPPSSWSAINAVLSGAADERTGGAGAQSIDIARSGNNSAIAYQDITVAVGTWYQVSSWKKRIDGNATYLNIETPGITYDYSTSTSWHQSTGTFLSTTNPTRVRLFNYSTGGDGTTGPDGNFIFGVDIYSCQTAIALSNSSLNSFFGVRMESNTNSFILDANSHHNTIHYIGDGETALPNDSGQENLFLMPFGLNWGEGPKGIGQSQLKASAFIVT